jgi:RNA polymerase sigma-70 factor (ECF subfamily)
MSAGYDGRVMDESALIQEAKQGDLESFNRLVLHYQSRVYNLAFRIMGDPAAASDATQEAFISAYKGLKKYRGGSFRAWLLRITTNACYDELRRLKRRPSSSLDDLTEKGIGLDASQSMSSSPPAENPEVEAERSELRRAIEGCLQNLPPEFRTVAILVDVQGYDYRETSEVIGKPIGTVKSRVARARERLRDCLKAYRELFPTGLRLGDEGNLK